MLSGGSNNKTCFFSLFLYTHSWISSSQIRKNVIAAHCMPSGNCLARLFCHYPQSPSVSCETSAEYKQIILHLTFIFIFLIIIGQAHRVRATSRGVSEGRLTYPFAGPSVAREPFDAETLEWILSSWI